MSWKVYIDERAEFALGKLAVHIARETSTGLEVILPMTMEAEAVEEGVAFVDPALYVDRDLARALYDALGHALGIYTPDARLAAEVLAREQDRVDKLIDSLIAGQ